MGVLKGALIFGQSGGPTAGLTPAQPEFFRRRSSRKPSRGFMEQPTALRASWRKNFTTLGKKTRMNWNF